MEPDWLFCDDFEACDVYRSGKYFDFGGGNYIVRDPVHSGNCAVRTGTPPSGQKASGWGKLVARLPDNSGYGELWMRGWVYFPDLAETNGSVGGHIWRPYDSPGGTQDRTLQFDFNVTSWNVVQMYFVHSPGLDFAADTGYRPTTKPNQWQCWETQIKLGPQGRMAFYVDGVLISEVKQGDQLGKVMADFRTDKTWKSIDVQSNSDSGGWWVLDDFIVSKRRVGCGSD